MIAVKRNDEIRILCEPGEVSDSRGVVFHHGDGGPRWCVSLAEWTSWLVGAHPVSGIVYREPSLTLAAGPGLAWDPVYHRVAPGILVPRVYRFCPPDFGFDAEGRRTT